MRLIIFILFPLAVLAQPPAPPTPLLTQTNKPFSTSFAWTSDGPGIGYILEVSPHLSNQWRVAQQTTNIKSTLFFYGSNQPRLIDVRVLAQQLSPPSVVLTITNPTP